MKKKVLLDPRLIHISFTPNLIHRWLLSNLTTAYRVTVAPTADTRTVTAFFS